MAAPSGATALALALLLLASCGDVREAPGAQAAAGDVRAEAGRELTRAELDQLCYAYADRYAALVTSACAGLRRIEEDPGRRRDALRLQSAAVEAVYDIASGPDPFAKLVDLVMVVTLQSRLWIDEGHAAELFGANGRALATASRQARVEAWDLAGRVLTPAQLQELDWLIWEWRRAHSQVTEVSLVRFDEAGGARGRALAAEVRAGSGLLAPVSEAVQSIERMRELSERALWYGKRAPGLLEMRLQAHADETLLRPEVAATLRDMHGVAGSIDRLAAVAEALPQAIARERQAVLAALSDQLAPMTRLIAEARGATTDATALAREIGGVAGGGERVAVELRQTAQTLTATIAAVQGLLGQLGIAGPAAGAAAAPNAPSKPFDIADYTAAVVELKTAVKELNTLVGATHGLLDSPAISKRIAELDSTANQNVERASSRAEGLVRTVAVAAVLVAAAFFALLLGYRVLARRVDRRGSA